MDTVCSSSILNNYDAFLVDLWGVIWLGAECRPIEGADRFISLLQQHNKEFYFLSNTVWPVENLEKQLSLQGIYVDDEQIITAGKVISENLQNLYDGGFNKRFFHAGRDWEPSAYFTAFNLCDDPRESEVILVGDFRWREGEEPPENAVQIEKGLKNSNGKTVIVCNPDKVTLQTDGKHAFQAGFFIEQMKMQYPNHTYIYVGKPFLPIYECALKKLPGIPKDRICMIGDSIDTDLTGARNAGIRSVLVCSGNTSGIPTDIQTDYILKSLKPETETQ